METMRRPQIGELWSVTRAITMGPSLSVTVPAGALFVVVGRHSGPAGWESQVVWGTHTGMVSDYCPYIELVSHESR